MFSNPFSGAGRIRRLEYGISIIISVIITAIADAIYINAESDGGLLFIIIIYIVNAWFILAQGVKRSHDIGNSGWWLLIPFYSLVIVFLSGEDGVNVYGNPPKQSTQSVQYGYQVQEKKSSTTYSSGSYDGGHNRSTGYSSGTNTPPSQPGSMGNDSNNDGEYKRGNLYN
jgi:uncharacterized membrane protein YhaH (DUF805 family)